MNNQTVEQKKRSKIIIDLIRDNISISQAFEILSLLLEDIGDKKIKKWVDCEINGYGKKDKIPDYRIVNSAITGSYIVGNAYNRLEAKNQPLPIKKEFMEEFYNTKIKEGINEIQQLALAEKEAENHNIVMSLDVSLAKHISLVNGQIINANINLSLYAYTNILGKLKSKLLCIFKELEKQYGNLDDYCIDFENDGKKEETVKSITNIIYDNSITIGDNNEISDSKVGNDNE